MNEFRDRQRSKWLRVAGTWYDTEPPAIPSLDDLAIFSRAIGDSPEPSRVLVLGSTPSLRAVAAERAASSGGVTLVMDLSSEMYEGSSAYAIHDLSGEKFIQSDWCAPSIASDQLSGIVGDKIIDNIAIGEWPRFFSEMRRILLADGKLVLHVGLTDELQTVSAPIVALASWAMKVREERKSVAEASAGLWEDLLSASWDRGPGGALSLSYWEPELTALRERSLGSVERQIVTRLFADFGSTFWDVWSDCRLPIILTTALDYFDLTSLHFAGDYLQASQQPIMVFRPKR